MSSTEDTIKVEIGARLREARGPRPSSAIAEKLGISARRLRQIEQGDVPMSWIYLVRLAEDGVDLDYLLRGNGR